jgi:TRAP-type C4-dicarboxylate transport system permease small subunit
VIGAWERGLDRLTRGIDLLMTSVTVLLLGFIVCANGIEILQRGVFNRSFQWLYEINLLACTWMYFLGMCLVYYRNKDITLDFVLLLLKGRPRRIYLVGVNLVAIATFAIILWYAISLMRLQMPFRTSGNGIPNPLFTLPVALACCSIVLILARQSIALWRRGEPQSAGLSTTLE